MTSHAHARKEIRPGSRTQTAELAALQPPALAQRVRKQREGVGGARWCLWELRVESLAAGGGLRITKLRKSQPEAFAGGSERGFRGRLGFTMRCFTIAYKNCVLFIKREGDHFGWHWGRGREAEGWSPGARRGAERGEPVWHTGTRYNARRGNATEASFVVGSTGGEGLSEVCPALF